MIQEYLKNSGTTIIFSTHRMEQVEEICEEIALIDSGKVILRGSVNDIKEKYKENKYNLKLGKLPDGDFLTQFETETIDSNSIKVKLTEDQTSTQMLKFLLDDGIEIKSFNESLPSLNEIFIKLVTANN